jgi:hypothetical protein
MDRLWQVLLRSVENEGRLSCDDCMVLMDYLSDLLAGGFPTEEVLAVADRYLQRCTDCQTALQDILAELTMAQQHAAVQPQSTVQPTAPTTH